MNRIPAILSHVADDSVDGAHDAALALAEAALIARHESPSDAMEAALQLVRRDDISDKAHLVALWALGVAERELNLLVESETHLRAAIHIGHEIGDEAQRARVTSSLVSLLAAQGKSDEALSLAAEVRNALDLDERADLEMKRAVVLYQVGRFVESLDAYSSALEFVDVGNDRILEARLRCNRSVVFAYLGDIAAALRDAEIAERLAVEHGQFYLAGGAAHNHAFIAGRHGDIVTALASFARADELYARVGYPGRCAGVLASDRCQVMLVAGLHDEARASAELAVKSLEDVSDVTDLAEARLLLAQACVAQGDHATALLEAVAARAQFEAADRDGWVAMADYVAIGAAHASRSELSEEVLSQARTIADNLDRLGWSAEANSVRITAAEMSIDAGDRDFARSQLLVAAAARETGRPDQRASAWLAEGMLRRADGDRGRAKRAVAAGLAILTEHQATLGATDLRVGASTHARRLASAGLAMSLETRRPRDVLTWAERVRANALAVPPVRPPPESPLAAALDELRRLRAELDEARRALSSDTDLATAVRRQEHNVRDLARMLRGDVVNRDALSIEGLQERLGDDRQLVEFLEHDGVISAVVVMRSRCTLRELGRVADVAALIDAAVFALGRLARNGASSASLAASAASLDDALDQLDSLLLGPLRLVGAEIVIVPTGVLHGVPWCGLPSVRNRATTVATSATRWAPRSHVGHGDEAVAIITGPGLNAAAVEAVAVREAYSSSNELAGPQATVVAALELLGRSGTAHIACHGNFRNDSPMFSSLVLADGPLTVYDVESLANPPSLVVLPACNAGVSAVRVGDELIGTASALLGTGVGTVIAPLTVVNDEATVPVMACLHRHLAAGRSPSDALAQTRIDIGDADIRTRAVAVAMLCLQ